MKLSDYIAIKLKQEGVETVFGYQGSSISHLIDSLCNNGIKYVQNYHEQASSFAACGYAETSNMLGVAIACSGPGATNLITGVANAYYDSLPCLFISGQVSTHELRNNSSRQNGFQETNIIDIVKPITKYSVEVSDPTTIKYELEKCIYLAKNGRPGPTFISLPHNVQSAQIDVEDINGFESETLENKYYDLNQIICFLSEAKRPLFLIGGGAHNIKNNKDFIAIRERYNIPCVASLRGINNVPNDDFIGFLGVYGTREANLAIYASDLIIVLGSRLDNRQTGGIASNFAPHAKIVHIDIDSNEINRAIRADMSYNCDCSHFLHELTYSTRLKGSINEFIEWHKLIELIQTKSKENYSNDYVNPKYLVKFICHQFINDPIVISTDVGQNQMWVAQAVSLGLNSNFLTSGGHGTMGYSLPSIIGGYFATKGAKHLIAFMGDGGFQMNMQELETLKRENIPVSIFIFVNHSLGLIRDYQEKALGNRTYGSVSGFSIPNLKELAKCFEMDYIELNDNDYSAISKDILIGHRTLVQVNVFEKSTISPELAYKKPIYDQSPHIDLNFLTAINK